MPHPTYIRINATDSDTQAVQTSYVKLNITFPAVSSNVSFEELVNTSVKLNLETPFFFKPGEGFELGSLSDYDNLFRHVPTTQYTNHFQDTVLYGNNSVDYLTSYIIVRPYQYDTFFNSDLSATLESVNGKKVLVDNPYYYGYVYGFYYPISDETRVLIAYRNGYETDEEKFPYAHSILEKGAAVIEEIIKDGMTEFEKEKAIL